MIIEMRRCRGGSTEVAVEAVLCEAAVVAVEGEDSEAEQCHHAFRTWDSESVLVRLKLSKDFHYSNDSYEILLLVSLLKGEPLIGLHHLKSIFCLVHV